MVNERMQSQALQKGIQIRRAIVTDINELFAQYPNATAYFNCSGLGSYSLKGVEDKSLYPTRVCPTLPFLTISFLLTYDNRAK